MPPRIMVNRFTITREEVLDKAAIAYLRQGK